MAIKLKIFKRKTRRRNSSADSCLYPCFLISHFSPYCALHLEIILKKADGDSAPHAYLDVPLEISPRASLPFLSFLSPCCQTHQLPPLFHVYPLFTRPVPLMCSLAHTVHLSFPFLVFLSPPFPLSTAALLSPSLPGSLATAQYVKGSKHTQAYYVDIVRYLYVHIHNLKSVSRYSSWWYLVLVLFKCVQQPVGANMLRGTILCLVIFSSSAYIHLYWLWWCCSKRLQNTTRKTSLPCCYCSAGNASVFKGKCVCLRICYVLVSVFPLVILYKGRRYCRCCFIKTKACIHCPWLFIIRFRIL